MRKIRVTECLDIDLEKEVWRCHRCDAELYSARDSYMKGCLVHDRPAAEVYGHPAEVGEGARVSYAPDPDFIRMLEFYCPGCGSLVEVQYLPPGHPIPRDIDLNMDKLKEKYLK
jgi:acetone carboxylase, gamma subunit